MHYRVRLLLSVFHGLVLPPLVSYALLSRLPIHIAHPARLVLSFLSLPLLDLFNTQYAAYKAAKLGALPIPVVRGNWPGNLDVLVRLLKGVKKGYINETFKEMCEECASPTINLRIMWVDQIWTHDPNHIRHILVSGFNHFGKGDEQRERMKGFLGRGIFAADNQLWKTHRSTVRPFLSKSQTRASDPNMWSSAVKGVFTLLESAAGSGKTIDIQDVAQRYTLDIALDVFLGIENAGMVDDLSYSIESAVHQSTTHASESAPTTLHLEDIATSPSHIKAFAHAMDKAADVVIMRARKGVMWRVVEFWSDRIAPLARTMHTWVDAVIERELRRTGDDNEETLVAHLVRSTDDKALIRDELINMVFGARDTTAALITFVVYFLAIERDVYTALFAEITRLCPPGSPLPSPEQLKEFVYLRAVLNETLRIFPSVPINTRYSTTESAFPPAVYNVHTNVNDDRRGNSNIDSRSSTAPPLSKYYTRPLYMPPNTSVSLLKLLMHRRVDLWGEDAEEFRPGRWLLDPDHDARGREQEREQGREKEERDGMGKRPAEWFVPFSAGPRLCPGQNFAYIEASYFIICLLQTGFAFDLARESQPAGTRPPGEWRAGDGHTQGEDQQHQNRDRDRERKRNETGVFARGKGRKAKEECWPMAAFTLFSKGGLWVSVSKIGQGV